MFKLSRIHFTKFGVLEFLWNRQNPLFLCIGSAQIFCACYLCLQNWLEVAVTVSVFTLFSRGSRSFYFLVDPVAFLFLFFLVYSDPLTLDSCCEGLSAR